MSAIDTYVLFGWRRNSTWQCMHHSSKEMPPRRCNRGAYWANVMDVPTVAACAEHVQTAIAFAIASGAAKAQLIELIDPEDLPAEKRPLVKAPSLSIDEFDRAVKAAMVRIFSGVSPELADRIEKLPISIADEGPTGCAGAYIFGQHVVVYRKWITDHVPAGETLTQCVEGVLLHEIGHALGLNHAELARCGV